MKWCEKHGAVQKVTCCSEMGWCERWDGIIENGDPSCIFVDIDFPSAVGSGAI